MELNWHKGRVKRIWYLSPMRAAKVQASLRIRAVSPEPPLLAHTSSESRGTFRQKARSLVPLNGWACAVKICHDGMLEDTNSLDGAQLKRKKKKNTNQSDSLCPYGAGALYNPKWIRLYYLELVRLRSWNTHRETDNGGISRGCPECSCRRDGRSTVSIFLLYYLQFADNLTKTSAVFPFLGISLVYMKISVPSFHPKGCKWLEWHNKSIFYGQYQTNLFSFGPGSCQFF